MVKEYTNPYNKKTYKTKKNIALAMRIAKQKRLAQYKKKPTRFYNSKQTYNATYKKTNALRPMSETHIVPLSEYDQEGAVAMAGNTDGYYKGFCTGVGVVPANLVGFSSLGGFNFPADVRGNHIYHRKVSCLFQIDMSPAQAITSITEFRVICFNQKRNNSVALMNPDENLFLAPDGSYFGWNTPIPALPAVGATGPKLMVAPTNRQKFNITKDIRFTLTSPQVLGTGAQTSQSFNSKYPSMKRFALHVPTYRKMTLDTSNFPADYDFTSCCVILSRTLAGENLSNDWTVSTMNGISTFTDM